MKKLTSTSLPTLQYITEKIGNFPLLEKINFKNKKLIGRLVFASYIPPQIINFKKYYQLATTPDIADFKIKDRKEQDFSYTKYYFTPNPLKMLVFRLLKIEATEPREEIYKDIINTLSRQNLQELFSYLYKNKDSSQGSKESKLEAIINNLKNAIEESLEIKIKSLTKDTNEIDWTNIFNLLSKTKEEKLEGWCDTIKNKIKGLPQKSIIKTWLKVAKNYQDDLESIKREYELIRKIDPTLGTKFYDDYLDTLILELNEQNIQNNDWINKFAYIFSYLDKINIDQNIKKVQEKLKSILDSSQKQANIIIPLAHYYNKTSVFLRNQENELDKFFLFCVHFGLHVYIYAENIVYNDSYAEEHKAYFFSNVLLGLILLKKQNQHSFVPLYNNYKNYLVSYINAYDLLKKNKKIKAELKELNIEIE